MKEINIYIIHIIHFYFQCNNNNNNNNNKFTHLVPMQAVRGRGNTDPRLPQQSVMWGEDLRRNKCTVYNPNLC